jgi:hypothetical protein
VRDRADERGMPASGAAASEPPIAWIDGIEG